MPNYFHSTIVSVGADAEEMMAGGAVVFFGQPCPQELADISIVHVPEYLDPQRDPQPGDTLRVGDSLVDIVAVGDLAAENLRTLGHIVVYCDPGSEQTLLPGAIHAAGQLTLPSLPASIELISKD